MNELQHVKLSFTEARRITDDIRGAVENVWTLLKKAHDGQAWEAIGYPTWAEYVRQEFQMTKQRSYQLLDYANLRSILTEQESTTVDIPTERQARPLTRLETPEQQRKAWQVAVEASGGKPTAKHVEAAVEVVKAKAEQPQEPISQPKKERFVYRPSNGLQIAEVAITHLARIDKTDTQRSAAFQRVTDWIQQNQ